VSYGLGMAVVLIVLTLGMALFKEGIIVSRLRGVLPYVGRAAAVLLVLAGSYIVYYWLFKGGLIERFAGAGGVV
ncbi:MAG: cytochrome c biogenesis protein CcdA, partial [Nitrospinota bacterium]